MGPTKNYEYIPSYEHNWCILKAKKHNNRGKRSCVQISIAYIRMARSHKSKPTNSHGLCSSVSRLETTSTILQHIYIPSVLYTSLYFVYKYCAFMPFEWKMCAVAVRTFINSIVCAEYCRPLSVRFYISDIRNVNNSLFMLNIYFYVEKYFIDDERYNVLHCGV